MKTLDQPNRLVIIAGISGKLGEEFLKYFLRIENTKMIGLSRKKIKYNNKKIKLLIVDLLDRETVKKQIEKISFRNVSDVFLIHCVGKFQFEEKGKLILDKDKDGIDDEIFKSNVDTFINIFKPLVRHAKKVNLIACAFGSITDRYKIPYWGSYSKSKDVLRKFIKYSILNLRKEKVRGVFINVSTTDTGNERNLRPNANKKYWLKPKEIVKNSIEEILKGKEQWKEIEIYKKHPKFKLKWYTNKKEIKSRWGKEMGK